MRRLCIAGMFLCAGLLLRGQAAAPADPAQDLYRALAGSWAGYLEYRDYSEPPTSTKRVQLPTWLTVTPDEKGVTLHYIYDDGPAKVVDETDRVVVDWHAKTYVVTGSGGVAVTYSVDGLERLKDGRGVLVLTGAGAENDKAAEFRVTVTVRRNLVEWLEESRAAGTGSEFAFRHLYRLTRTQTPAVTGSR